MKVSIDRSPIEIATVHFAQRPTWSTQPSLFSVKGRNAVAIGHVGQRDSLFGIFRVDINRQRFATEVDGTLHDPGGDLIDGRRATNRLNVLIKQLIGGWTCALFGIWRLLVGFSAVR